MPGCVSWMNDLRKDAILIIMEIERDKRKQKEKKNKEEKWDLKRKRNEILWEDTDGKKKVVFFGESELVEDGRVSKKGK